MIFGMSQRVHSQTRLEQRTVAMMNRLTFVLQACLIAAFSLGMCRCTLGGAVDAQRPNIVFILIDDLGWADLGCYGSRYYETPRIDQLASQGMRFTDAYAACPACSPTRASILTGRYPARLHLTDWIPGQTPRNAKLAIPDWRKFLPCEELTIAEVFKLAGYATAAVGKWHLGPEPYFPEKQGFDLNVAGSNIGAPKSYFYPYGERPKLPDGKSDEYLTDRLTDEALEFITAHRQEPFFLYLAHYAVHTPIQAKPELIANYRDKAGSNGQTSATYAAMVESVDQSVGRLLDALQHHQLTERTLVILFSDNGGLARSTATSNVPLRSGKGFPFEGGVRVPLIVRWPGVVPSGSTCEDVVTSVDFFPTVLEILGADDAQAEVAETDGVSLMPLLTRSGTLSRDAVYWHYPHYNPIGGFPYGAIRQGDWKLIEFYEDGHTELYNLRDDMGETTDLARTEPEIASKLAESLHRWRISVKAQMPRPRQRTASGRAGT